jgi:hypothetical protein
MRTSHSRRTLRSSDANAAVRIPSTESGPVDQIDVYALITSGAIRGQVERFGLIPNDRGGFVISAAGKLLVEHPAMRPDIADEEIPPAADLAADDELLSSLSQFDIAYCFVMAAEGRRSARYYPMSSA